MKKYALLLLCALFLSACGGNSSPGLPPGDRSGPSLSGPALDPSSVPATSDSVSVPNEPDIPDEPDAAADPVPDPRAEAVQKILSAMSDEEKVGQIFFARCPGSGAVQDVAAYHLGGLLLFGRDFKDGNGEWLTAEQFSAAISSYQSAAAVPLLIGVDEEGGTVARASRDPYLFPEKAKSPQELFALGGLDAVSDDAEQKSLALLSYGINVNLAPVADVSTNPGDFIYDRSFGQDAKATAAFVSAAVSAANSVRFSSGGRSLSIGSVLKHFPGYGGNADTHTGSAFDNRTYEQFAQSDFLPFKAGIDAGAGAVLVSHNVVSAFDPGLPASLSPAVHQVLRDELGFSGVAITDDLNMDAIDQFQQDGSAAVLAVLAGNDLIISSDYQNQIPQIISALNDGSIPHGILDAAVSRVLSWKFDLGLLEGLYD